MSVILIFVWHYSIIYISPPPPVDVHDVALLKQQLAEMDKTLKTKTLVSIG